MSKTSLTIRYLIAISLVAFFVVLTYFLQIRQSANEDARLDVVNVCGRQRMLSQRILAYGWKYFMATRKQDADKAGAILTESAREMEAAHLRLIGQGGLALAMPMSAEIRRIFFEEPIHLDARVREYLKTAVALTKERPGTPACAQVLGRLEEQGATHLLEDIDNLVARYQHEGEARIATLEKYQIISLVCTLLLLTTVALAIFRPMVDAVCQDKARMEIMNTRLETMSITDELTQAYNRRKFQDIFRREIELFKRYKTPLSLAIFDIDHFKAINDRLGHLTGDVILSELSALVRANIRKTDYLFRWGGEEFLLVLPQTDKEAALILAEKLRRMIEETKFRKSVDVTVSLGVATFSGTGDESAVLEAADKALYAAKEAGRNMVMAA